MKPFCLEVRGDYACFTRPEMKVERVSYDQFELPGEYLQTWYRGDSYYLTADLEA